MTSVSNRPTVRARWCFLRATASLAAPPLVLAQRLPLRGYPADAVAGRTPLGRAVSENPEPKRVRGYIRAMTAVPHVAGTPGSKRVAEWALARVKEWGLGAARREQAVALSLDALR